MKYYRIYQIGCSNQIKAAFDITCGTDDEALDVARRLTGPEPAAEVWQSTRLVGRVGRQVCNAASG
jgi:hypothetical protein